MAVVWFLLLVAVVCGFVGALGDDLWWLLAVGAVLALAALLLGLAKFRRRAGRPLR